MALTRQFGFLQIGIIRRGSKLFSTQQSTGTPSEGSSRGKDTFEEGQGHTTGNERDLHDLEDEKLVKNKILNVALNYVKIKGWNVDSISAAANELSLAPSVSGIFTDYDLIKFFITKNNVELEKHLSENQVNVRDAMEWRLKKIVPYIDGYTEAIAIAAQPQNMPRSIRLLQQMADTIAHHSLKDTSTDLNWYTKRATIAALYMSSELCLVQDKSEGLLETWKFLDRRALEFEKLKKGGFEFGSLPLPEVCSAGFTTLRNILGRNAPR